MTPLGVPVEPEVKMMYSEQRRVLAAREQLLRDQDRAGKVQRLRLVVKRALHDHQIGVQRV